MPAKNNLKPLSILFLSLCLGTSLYIGCADESPTQPADTLDPWLEWRSPEPGTIQADTCELRIFCYDESGIDRLQVYRNGFAVPEWLREHPADNICTLSWDTRAVEDGVYILEARAWDEACNLGISPSLLIKVKNNPEPPPEDRTPPDVWWTAPEAGSTLQDTVSLKLRFFDESGVDSVQLLKNGAVVVTLPPYASRGGQRGGQYRLSEETPPNPPLLRRGGSEQSRLRDEGSKTQGGASNDTMTYLWDTRSDSDGVYVWEARAWDMAGNMGSSPSLLLRVRNNPPPPEDRLPPDVWWTAPEAGSTLQDTVSLKLRFFDESGVDSVRLLKNGAVVVTLPPYASRGGQRGGQYRLSEETPPNPPLLRRGGSEGGASNDTLTYLWDTRSDSDGVYVWEARAWDTAGNMGSSPSLLLRVRNNPVPPPEDRTPPVISWRSPEPGDTLEGAVRLRFQVMDVSPLDSVQVYLNGQKWQNFHDMGNFFDGDVTWRTYEWSDGNYIVQVKAWDAYGNVGLSEVIWFAIWNNRPRVIWVPDDFETIQEAINASHDGDTVRVRAGVYQTIVQFFAKTVSLVSESGPLVTTISGDVMVGGGQDSVMLIRGFRFESTLYLDSGASPRIVNNIFRVPEGDGILAGGTYALIRNNVFIDSQHAAQIAHDWGDFLNNIIVNMSRVGFWNAAVSGQPLVPDYNLFWNCHRIHNDQGMIWGEHNIEDQDPLFEEDSFRLQVGSPAIDAGDPNIRDLNDTRSDMGVHGGPHAYR